MLLGLMVLETDEMRIAERLKLISHLSLQMNKVMDS